MARECYAVESRNVLGDEISEWTTCACAMTRGSADNLARSIEGQTVHARVVLYTSELASADREARLDRESGHTDAVEAMTRIAEIVGVDIETDDAGIVRAVERLKARPDAYATLTIRVAASGEPTACQEALFDVEVENLLAEGLREFEENVRDISDEGGVRFEVEVSRGP